MSDRRVPPDSRKVIIRHWLRHHWTAVGENQGKAGDMRFTIVLYRCDCGKSKTEELQGWWTLDELNGRS